MMCKWILEKILLKYTQKTVATPELHLASRGLVWLHALPTQQPSDLPAKARALMNDKASGGCPGKGPLAPRGGG